MYWHLRRAWRGLKTISKNLFWLPLALPVWVAGVPVCYLVGSAIYGLAGNPEMHAGGLNGVAVWVLVLLLQAVWVLILRVVDDEWDWLR